MDHWGDPWADDANKPQTKHELTSPLPTTSHAPVLLQGFLDDAQWGSNESGEFGAWATSPRKEDTIHAAVQETRVPDSTDISFDNDAEKTLDYNDWGIEKNGQNNNWAWSEAHPDSPKEPENVVSESSDSATTIQPDETPEQASVHSVDAAQPDDDLSTRPSTSPSEISHNEATVESPRTSFEEERAVDKAAAAEDSRKAADAVTDTSKVGATALEATTSDGVDDDFGDFEDDAVRNDGLERQRSQETLDDDTAETPRSPQRGLDSESALASDTEPEQKASYIPSTSPGGFTIDSELMSQLFPPPKDVEQLEEPPDDPIYSTSARKAWYRLTRKQTMREFNNGNDDDNYIRVTWATSHIRSEVNKIVGRWATEDRMSGKGPGARASFYWDTPAPTHSRAPSSHVRKPSSTSVSSPLRPAKPNVPPLSTKAPAAFNWSSPTTSANPWNQPSPNAQPTPPLLAPKHPAVKAIPRPEGRAVSVDLTPRTIAETLHKRTSTTFDLPKPPAPFAPLPANHLANSPVAGSPLATSSVASSSLANSPLANPSVAGSSSANSPHGNSSLSHSPFANSPLVNSLTANDPWANVNNLDHNPPPSTETAAAPDHDDDDWGEMVQSPAVSNPTPIEPSIRDNTLSTPTSTPKSAKTSPIQNLPPGSKHASPIVRLKSVISPTSARFKLNSYIPAGAEEGPIGPGLLKPANKSVESTPEQKIRSRPASGLENRDEPASPTFAPQIDVSEDFSAWDTASPQTASTTPKDELVTPDAAITLPEPVKPTVLPSPSSTQATPAQTHSSEAWADADFSFFETAAPGPSKPPLQIQPKHDPSDPFSIFETTTPLSPAPLTPFTRPPPRPVTPPTLQPLTGATNSAQKRKAEEDELIKSIVRGLPDLSYMLRV